MDCTCGPRRPDVWPVHWFFCDMIPHALLRQANPSVPPTAHIYTRRQCVRAIRHLVRAPVPRLRMPSVAVLATSLMPIIGRSAHVWPCSADASAGTGRKKYTPIIREPFSDVSAVFSLHHRAQGHRVVPARRTHRLLQLGQIPRLMRLLPSHEQVSLIASSSASHFHRPSKRRCCGHEDVAWPHHDVKGIARECDQKDQQQHRVR